jgi:hypothetical protein
MNRSQSSEVLFAILDPAVDPSLHAHAVRLEPHRARCLFQGKLHPEVKAVSPHLLELAADDPLAAAWATTGRGANWGVMIESSAGLHKVWRRVRHFTQATLPDGTGPLLFRFWDPRVFRVYAPLIEPDQVGEWFQDIDAWRAETEDGQGWLRYTAGPGGVVITPA